MRRHQILLATLLLAITAACTDLVTRETLSIDAAGIHAIQTSSLPGTLRIKGKGDRDEIQAIFKLKRQVSVEEDTGLEDSGSNDADTGWTDETAALELTVGLQNQGGVAVLSADLGALDPGDYWLKTKVLVPSGLDVQTSLVAESVELDDVGAVEILDGAGSIQVQGAVGNVDISDDSGSVTVLDVDGNVNIVDSGGRIVVKHVDGNVEIRDGRGSIKVRDVSGKVTIWDTQGKQNIKDVGETEIHDEAG